MKRTVIRTLDERIADALREAYERGDLRLVMALRIEAMSRRAKG